MCQKKSLDKIVEQITTAYKIEPIVKDGSIFVSHDDYSATFTVSSSSNSLFDLTLLYRGNVVMSELVSSYRLMEHLGVILPSKKLSPYYYYYGDVVEFAGENITKSNEYIQIPLDTFATTIPDSTAIENHIVAFKVCYTDNGDSVFVTTRFSCGHLIDIVIPHNNFIDIIELPDTTLKDGWFRVDAVLYSSHNFNIQSTNMYLVGKDEHNTRMQSLYNWETYITSQPFDAFIPESSTEYEVVAWYTTADGMKLPSQRRKFIVPYAGCETKLIQPSNREPEISIIQGGFELRITDHTTHKISYGNGEFPVYTAVVNSIEEITDFYKKCDGIGLFDLRVVKARTVPSTEMKQIIENTLYNGALCVPYQGYLTYSIPELETFGFEEKFIRNYLREFHNYSIPEQQILL